MSLTGKQKRHLRGIGHSLEPVVQIGREGVSEALIQAVDEALTSHELIKVKIGQNAPVERHEVADSLAAQTSSQVAQVLGNTLLLYRADPDNPVIVLPEPGIAE